MTKRTKPANRLYLFTAAAALAAACAGCQSQPKDPYPSDAVSDTSEQNRLLIRMALEENVYNGIAAERAVYSKDFRIGTAILNPLGSHRVDMLIDASRGGSGQITVLRGDAPDELYTARVAAVQQQLADAGLKDITAAKGDHVAGGGVASDRAILTYGKMMSEYAPRAVGNGASGAMQPMAPSLNTASKGQ